MCTFMVVKEEKNMSEKRLNERVLGMALAIGAGVGTALGVALDNIALGVAIGAGNGVVFAFARARN